MSNSIDPICEASSQHKLTARFAAIMGSTKFLLAVLCLVSFASCHDGSTESRIAQKDAIQSRILRPVPPINSIPDSSDRDSDTLWINDYDVLIKIDNGKSYDLVINAACPDPWDPIREIEELAWQDISILFNSRKIEDGVKIKKWSASFAGPCEFRKSRSGYYTNELKKYRLKELGMEDLFEKLLTPAQVFALP